MIEDHNEGYDYSPFIRRETLFERTVRAARANESVSEEEAVCDRHHVVRTALPIFLTRDELELVVLALGLLLAPAAATLQARLAVLR